MEAAGETFCVVVPAYNEARRIGEVVLGIRRHCPDVIVVDDGSKDDTARVAAEAGATVIRHTANRGKGAALNTGFQASREGGYAFVITMDADGQHAPEDLPAFLKARRETGFPVLVGTRMDQAQSMPLVRRLTNRFMSWLLSRRMGQRVPDTQCGFRLFARDALPTVPTDSQGFAAESEVLLDLAEGGARIGSVPIQVIYRDETSKIRPVRDTLRFLGMLRRRKKERP
jgi:glycosyltransferase involved in cell wall biosynthesis